MKINLEKVLKLNFIFGTYCVIFVLGIIFATHKIDKMIPEAPVFLNIKTSQIKKVLEAFHTLLGKHCALLIDDYHPGKSGITISTQNVQPGYILISRLSSKTRQFIVELMNKKTGEVVQSWAPSYEGFYKDPSVPFDKKDAQSIYNMVYSHPLLLGDGSLIIIVDAGGRIARVDKNSKILWQINGDFHHSINLDHEGNLWVPSKKKSSDFKLHPLHGFKMKDYDKWITEVSEETLVKLSIDGKILEEISLLDILLDNKLKHTFVSTKRTAQLTNDLTHLNDIEPVLEETSFAKKGDLFLSMRSINLVLQYRPSTKKVIWSRIGPWIAQHDVTIDNDQEISVLSNDRPIDNFDETFRSTVYTYNFETDTITEPYAKAIDVSKFFVWSEGLQTVLPNGNVLLEETVQGRILELSPNSVEWEYVNRFNDTKLGALSWSRFVPENKVDENIFR